MAAATVAAMAAEAHAAMKQLLISRIVRARSLRRVVVWAP